MSSQLIDNRKIIDGVVATPGTNTNTWYTRELNGSFSVNGSFNGAEAVFDWVLNKTSDSKFIKAGVVKMSSSKKSLQVQFDTSFPDNNYYVFFLQNSNVSSWWLEKKVNRFVIAGSWELGQEVSWLAIHRDFARKTGIQNPGTIFAGSRTMDGLTPDISGAATLDITDDEHSNLNSWYNNEYIIEPTTGIPDNFQQLPNLEEYSIILSTNNNINTYWVEKANDRFKIATSFDQACIIDYLMIKKGIDWWNEF